MIQDLTASDDSAGHFDEKPTTRPSRNLDNPKTACVDPFRRSGLKSLVRSSVQSFPTVIHPNPSGLVLEIITQMTRGGIRTGLLIALTLPMTLRAGLCTDAQGAPRHDFQFFAGYSPVSTVQSHAAPDRQFLLAGFSYSYRCWVWSSTSLSYTAAAMPLASLIEPDEIINQHEVPGHVVYGFAIASVGVTLELARKRRVHPFLETLEGIIGSTEPIPENVPNATGLNFLYSLGGGIRRNIGSRQAISLGYRFMHISNAGTTSVNPSVNNNVIYIGYSFLR